MTPQQIKHVDGIQAGHWREAAEKYPPGEKHVMARVNYLRKHFYYSVDGAWLIVNNCEGTPAQDDNSYVVADLQGHVQATGDEAKSFVTLADKLGIERTAYRLFIEVFV